LVESTKAAGVVTVTEPLAEQPALSVTVTEYEPAARLDAKVPLAALLHVRIKGAVPELTTAEAVSSEPPKHETGEEESVTVGFEVPPTTTVAVLLHPFASVTVT